MRGRGARSIYALDKQRNMKKGMREGFEFDSRGFEIEEIEYLFDINIYILIIEYIAYLLTYIVLNTKMNFYSLNQI